MDIQQYSLHREAEAGTGTDWFVGLGGFGVSLLIAGVLEGPRATIGSTNVALFLAVVVVAAGVLGRRAGGWITALGAALSFNFFHTRPVHTLRIASGRDVITVVLLAALGGLAGELAHRRQTAVRNAEGGRESTRVLHLNAEECRTATSANAAVLSSTAAITQLLGAESVAFEHGAAGLLVGRHQRLPDAGVRDPVGRQPGRIEHHLVLAHHAAHAGDFSHVGYGLELIAQEPVLQSA